LNNTAHLIDIEFKVNKTIANGRYVLNNHLGKGAHGRVYSATDLKATIDIPIAIKTVRCTSLPLLVGE
jgi:hypothetical protein